MPEDKKVKKEEKQIETLNINCPSCSEENTVKLSSEIKCKHCEEPLTFYKTIKEYDYKDFKENQYDFLSKFESNSRECR